MILRNADPNTPGGGGGSTPPAPGQPPAPPATPKAVAKTPIKTPNEIRLEKVVAGLEDKVSSLEESITSINSLFEELKIGASPNAAPVPVKPGKVTTPTPTPTPTPKTGGIFETIDKDIWGNPGAN